MRTRVHQHEGYLSGQLLISMPGMPDARFSRSVIYLCSHNEHGAMGLIVNQIMETVNFSDVLTGMCIEANHVKGGRRVHFGGPVETGRGFVLHSTDYVCDETIQINDSVSLTTTVDILRLVASGAGPKNSLFALGYAGWGPGQLDTEIQGNGWMFGTAETDILFGDNNSDKWASAAYRAGIDFTVLSSESGNA